MVKKLLKKLCSGVGMGCFVFVAMLFIAPIFAGGANVFFAEKTGVEWQLTALCCISALAAGGDVAGAVEQTWKEAATQIKSVVEKVVFPALDMILAIAFFVKLGGAYFDFRQRGQFEWTGPAILFACLIFTLTAPKYIWSIIGI